MPKLRREFLNGVSTGVVVITTACRKTWPIYSRALCPNQPS